MKYTFTLKDLILCITIVIFQCNIHANTLSTQTALVNILEEDCSETAFALLNSDDNPNEADAASTCFIPQFSRWGWTTFLDFSEETGQSSYEFSFVAGAGQCDLSNGTAVGTITVTYNNDQTVTFDYNMSGDFILSEAHVYLGTAMYPTKNNGAETVAPGQYTHKNAELGDVQSYSVTLPSDSDQVYVIIHGVTENIDCTDDEDEEECPDSDNDGVCDNDDLCPGFDDNVDSDGDGIPDGCDDGGGVFKNYLFNLYPEPFKDSITIKYKFNYETDIRIDVFDTQGNRVTNLYNNTYAQGEEKTTQLNISALSEQLFFIRVITNKHQFTKKYITAK